MLSEIKRISPWFIVFQLNQEKLRQRIFGVKKKAAGIKEIEGPKLCIIWDKCSFVSSV